MTTNYPELAFVLRPMVRGAYQQQQLRIALGNRLCAAFRTKLGLHPNEPEKPCPTTGIPVDPAIPEEEREDVKQEARVVLENLRKEFAKITDGVKRELPLKKNFKGTPLISSYAELCLVASYLEMEKGEKNTFARLESILLEHRLYTELLQPIAGCGPAMAAVIMSEMDIHKAKYPSSLWVYCGVGVEPDGRGTSKRKEHLYDVEYKDRDGKMQTKKSIRHNNWLKTKLCGVLSGCIIKASVRWVQVDQDVYDVTPEDVRAMKDKKNEETGKKEKVPCVRMVEGKYAKAYYDYRKRLNHKAPPGEGSASTVDWTKATELHKHRAAARYMIKILLMEIYNKWREIEGLEVYPPYHEAKLGLRHTEGGAARSLQAS